jgi:hypothetical protein
MLNSKLPNKNFEKVGKNKQLNPECKVLFALYKM